MQAGLFTSTSKPCKSQYRIKTHTQLSSDQNSGLTVPGAVIAEQTTAPCLSVNKGRVTFNSPSHIFLFQGVSFRVDALKIRYFINGFSVGAVCVYNMCVFKKINKKRVYMWATHP